MATTPPSAPLPSLTVRDLWHNSKATATQVAQLYFGAEAAAAEDATTDGGAAKTYIITGATSGLGRQLALVLGTASIRHRRPIHLILAVRNVAQGKELADEILRQQHSQPSSLSSPDVATTSNPKADATVANVCACVCNIQVWSLDLTRLQSVRQFAEQYKEWSFSNSNKSDGSSTATNATDTNDKNNDDNHHHCRPSTLIHGLVNNAGVYGAKGLSEDGFLITWQVNALAPFLLTQLLEPYYSDDARVVNVSSLMHAHVGTFGGNPAVMGGLDLTANCGGCCCCSSKKMVDVPSRCPPQPNHSPTYDYALSKACQVLHAHALTIQFTQAVQQPQQQQTTTEDKTLTSNSNSNHNHSRRRRLAFAVDPGVIRTNLSRHQTFSERFSNSIMVACCGRSVDQGCSTILFCLLASVQDLQPTSNYQQQPQPQSQKKKNTMDPDAADTIEDDRNQPTNHVVSPPFYYSNCAPAEPVAYCNDVEQALAFSRRLNDLLREKGL